MPNYTRVRLKISEHRTYGVMNQNLSSIYMYGGARQTHVSGSVKVYGSISTIAVGALVKIAGKMKAEKYRQL